MNIAEMLNNANYQHITPEQSNPGEPLPEYLVAGTMPHMTPAQQLVGMFPATPPNLPPIMSLYRRSYNDIVSG